MLCNVPDHGSKYKKCRTCCEIVINISHSSNNVNLRQYAHCKQLSSMYVERNVLSISAFCIISQNCVLASALLFVKFGSLSCLSQADITYAINSICDS